MPTQNGNRFERLLRLIAILQRRPGIKALELSEQVGVSQRQIFRDLGTLKTAGVPIERADENEGYRLGEAFRLPRLELTDAEHRALGMLPRILRDFIEQPQMRSAASALNKINGNLAHHPAGSRKTKHSPTQVAGLNFLSARQPDVGIVDRDAQWFNILCQAIEDTRVCNISYQAASDKKILHLPFEPRHLHFWSRAWYVIGHCRKHNQTRMLKLTRIKAIDLTTDGFKIEQPFSISKYLKNAWGLQATAPDTRVVIVFSPKVANNVREVQWHPTQKSFPLSDGSLQLEFIVAGIEEISWWIAGYADQAYVLEPAPLRELLRTRAEQTRAFYNGADQPRPVWAAQNPPVATQLTATRKPQAARRRQSSDLNLNPTHDLIPQIRQVAHKTTPRKETESL